MLQVQEIELVKLHPWENNPRVNDHAVDAVAESIRSFGFKVPILCDRNLIIIAGRTRWKAAKKLGMDLSIKSSIGIVARMEMSSMPALK